MSTAQRYAQAEAEGWSGLWGNMLLTVVKGVMGWLTGSKALLADAFRSAAEAAGAFAALTGLRDNRKLKESKKSKPSHAQDSGKGTGARILMSVLLLIIGLEVGISAIRELVEGVAGAPHWSALAAIAAGWLFKELFSARKERHSGLYCTLAAFIGAGAAITGKALAIPALYYFDPAAALVIAVIVVFNGFQLVQAIARKDARQEAQEEDPNELMQLIQRVEGVVTVESLRAREHGHYVVADIVISVNPRITVLEGQEIAKRVKQLLMKRFLHLTDVSIYVEPYDPGYPYKSNHDPNQEQVPTLLQ
ncbi:cation diffusion facilitator family transporter [Paenibacillus harenae]|uniref:Divalent metal cation (Fe/Co/Zn/Cd) transporter n=1 Tax=Paenibacillus harenae TaxID=306543 RepID=A0ABT9TXN0_PAEHA|nr:cation transporter dimerization domain-containing protein [Paenibacillus harenae]MDQ0110814.1 divalent metal cation (Fe/Co/Zn/Cd) transporter [Paenibacillus harenae]